MIAFIFDTETSGLIDNHTLPIGKQPSVIEFFGQLVDLSSKEIKHQTEFLIRPPAPVSDEITRITGLTNMELSDKPKFEDIAPNIKLALEEAPLVIAHNLSFDKEMIDFEFERLGTKITWPRLLCTVEATIHINGFRMTLTQLHEHLFGEPFKNAHRARVDVEALTRCCGKLFALGEI